jgi:hypothetical protein
MRQRGLRKICTLIPTAWRMCSPRESYPLTAHHLALGRPIRLVRIRLFVFYSCEATVTNTYSSFAVVEATAGKLPVKRRY